MRRRASLLMRRALLPLAVVATTAGLVPTGGFVSAVAEDEGASTACPADPEVWAVAMTDTLPTFANREFARTPYGNSIMRVSIPEVVPVDDSYGLGDGGADGDGGGTAVRDDLVHVFFSTTERWYDSATYRILPRAYRVLLASTQTPEPSQRSWSVVSVSTAQSPRSTSGLAPRDSSYAAIANAIREWQYQGCPSP